MLFKQLYKKIFVDPFRRAGGAPIPQRQNRGSWALPAEVPWQRPLFLVLLLLACSATSASEVVARVVQVDEGDVLRIVDAGGAGYQIRLAFVDAPEPDQPFGEAATARLAELLLDKPVQVTWNKIDRYGRAVGTVRVASPDLKCEQGDCPMNLDAGLALLASGLAWHFKRYQHEQGEEERARYDFAESEARRKRAGLWADPDPAPPWEWRERARLNP